MEDIMASLDAGDDWAQEQAAIIRAVYKAGLWLHAPEHRMSAAEIIVTRTLRAPRALVCSPISMTKP